MSIKYKRYTQPLLKAVRSGKAAARNIVQILNDDEFLRCVEQYNPELLTGGEQSYATSSSLYKAFLRGISRKLNEIASTFDSKEPGSFIKLKVAGERGFGRTQFYWRDDIARNDALSGDEVSAKRIEARVFAFRFIDGYLKHLFPPSLIQELKDDIDDAGYAENEYVGLGEKLKFWPAFIRRNGDTGIDYTKWHSIFSALMQQRVFEARYASIHNKVIPEQVTLSPQRIEYINHDIKLLAYVHEIGAYHHFGMDKLTAPKPAETTRFHKLNWDNYEQPYEFEFRAADWVINHLVRIGFGDNIRVRSNGTGTARITGQVLLPTHFNHGGVDVFDCVNFLAGFGDALQVLKPLPVRDELKRRAQAMLALYEDDSVAASIPILLKSAHLQTANTQMLDAYTKRYGDKPEKH